MTSFALSLGCALLAFSPTLSLLLLFAYSKAQLVIIVTTSAFAQLLSCLLSALLHLPFKLFNMGLGSVYIIIPTSVLSQAFCRCGFVYLYHKVEGVIEKSIQRHENEFGNTNNANNGNTNANGADGANNATSQLSETEKLRLEFNDVSAGIAAGVGFGFMHTVMLYGTLLASEDSRMGTLYQTSCTFMPSIFNSAVMAFFFGILDLFFMLFTFYGMRRLPSLNGADEHGGRTMTTSQYQNDRGHVTGLLGSKAALVLVLILHSTASFATTPNQFMDANGCVIALPSLLLVTGLTIGIFWYLCWNNYLPEGQRHRIRLANHLD